MGCGRSRTAVNDPIDMRGSRLPNGYDSLVYSSTHYSFSKLLPSLRDQLNSGVRGIHLVVYYSPTNGFLLGHGGPGSRINSCLDSHLESWLRDIRTWSQDEKGDHSPITIWIEIRTELCDVFGLNDLVQHTFGPSLFTPEELKEQHQYTFPAISSMQGKVVVVLSGHSSVRNRYRFSPSNNPSAAINSNGIVVVVHESLRRGSLHYFVGEFDNHDDAVWRASADYEDGCRLPSVSVNDSNIVLEVHCRIMNELCFKMGRITDRFRIEWLCSGVYDVGIYPTVALNNINMFICLHGGEGDNEGSVSSRVGVVDPDSTAVVWRSARGDASNQLETSKSTVATSSLHFLSPNSPDLEIIHVAGNLKKRGTVQYLRRLGSICEPPASVVWKPPSIIKAKVAPPSFQDTPVSSCCSLNVVSGEHWQFPAGLVAARPWKRSAQDSCGSEPGSNVTSARSAQSSPACSSPQQSPAPNILFCRFTVGGKSGPYRVIRPRQLLFVESSLFGETLWFDPETRFVGCSSKEREVPITAMEENRVVRMACFNQSACRRSINPNFPATNHPKAHWYQVYLNAVGVRT